MRLLKSLVFLIALCSSAYAADPVGLISYPPSKMMGFRGMDTRSNSPLIADGRGENLLNVKLSAAFDLQKRPGYDVINDATLDDLSIDSPPITGIFDTLFSTGSSWTLVFVGNKLKYDASGTWTTAAGSGTITSGENNQWQCTMALDSAVCTNDADAPLKVNSTPAHSALSFTGLSNAITDAKTLVWYRNYLIFGNTIENGTSHPTRFRWSTVGTIETWSNNDFVDLSTFAGDEIVGFSELYGDLYIFLTKSIWKASLVGGDDVFVFRKVIDGIGAIARDSIQLISFSDNRSAVIFLDERKRVLMFDGVSVVDVGALIQPTLDDLAPARLQYAVSTFDGKDYYLCATSAGEVENDICFDLQTEIFEWTRHDQIDANAMAQVKETTSVIKTYFGNYDAFVYWMDNPDLNNDVDGAVGIVDSVATVDTATITGAQILIDASLTSGIYTGATVRISSGTANDEERVIVSSTSTGVIVSSPFSTTPDSTSVYEIGVIDTKYHTRHFDLGNVAQEKVQFLGMLVWGKEQSNSQIDATYAVDFGANLGSEVIDFTSEGALWDVGIWDVDTWGGEGDGNRTVKFTGNGSFLQIKLENNSADETFHLYGYNIIAIGGDIKQP